MLINATNFAREFTRYNESLYYPLVGLMILVFMQDFYKLLPGKTRVVAFAVIICIALIHLNGIRKNGEYLKLRTFQLEEIIQASQNERLKKSLVRLENVEKERWVLNWSYPMESLLLSSIDGPAKSVSLIADEDFDYRDTSIELTQQRFILRRWEIRDDTDLLKFFSLKTGNYITLNNTDSTLTSDQLNGKISLALNTEEALEAYSRIFIPVEINNNSGRKIPSLPVDANYFHVQMKNSEQSSSMDIPFDIDLSGNYTEVVSCPLNGIKKPWSISVKMIVGGVEIASTETTLN